MRWRDGIGKCRRRGWRGIGWRDGGSMTWSDGVGKSGREREREGE